MATLNFIRSVNTDLQTKEDLRFNPVLVIARDDSGAVDFTGKTIKMDIYSRDAIVDTLTSGTEITISTNTLTIDKVFSALAVKAYDYILYNDTDKIGIMHGLLIVI